MAEAILGVVAGGAGLASLALQLFETAQKIHEMSTNIRNAPIEIHDILDEVELLRHVLTDYLNLPGIAGQTFPVPTLAQKHALAQCFKVLEVLRDIGSELEANMQTSNSKRLVNWAKVKAAFNQKRFVRLQATLERAKTTLVLAMLTDQKSNPERRLSGNKFVLVGPSGRGPPEIDPVTTNLANLESPVTRARTTRCSSRLAMYNLGIARILTRAQNSPPEPEAGNSAPTKSLKKSISFASWLFNHMVTLKYACGVGKVWVTLQIDRLVRPDAEIFHLCAAGDALGVQKLIADGKASPLDVTYEGVTPLMIAASYLHADVCGALLDAGANVNATVVQGFRASASIQLTALHYALSGGRLPCASDLALINHGCPWSAFWAGSLRNILGSGNQMIPSNIDTVRLLVQHRESCVDIGWSPLSHDSSRIEFSRHIAALNISQSTPEDFLWLTAPERINLLGSDLDLFYMSLVMTQVKILNSDLRRISIVFSRVADLSKLARIHDEFQRTILHYLVCLLPYFEDERLQILVSMLYDLVQVGAVEIADSLGRHTSLTLAARLSIQHYLSLHSSWQPELASQCLARGLKIWLEILARAGMDLRRYLITQRDRGAGEMVYCVPRDFFISHHPEHFLDHDWYVELSFSENSGATEVLIPDDIGIEVKYHCFQSAYPAPGAWPEVETESNQQDVGYIETSQLEESDMDSSDHENEDEAFGI